MAEKKINRMNLLAIGILVIAVGSAASAQAQTVVRLFSTPAERAELERQRMLLYRPDLLQVAPEPEAVAELPVALEPERPDVIYRLGGSMQRSDGLYTIWLNGNPINQEDLPDNMELLQPFSQGRLRIRNPANGVIFEIKPGQVLNFTTGELYESYQSGGNRRSTEAAESVTESPAEDANLESQNSNSD